MSSSKVAPLPEEEPALVEEEPEAPVDEEPAPVEEEPEAPVEEEPAPVEEEPAPVEGEPASGEEQPAPVEEKPAPGDEKNPFIIYYLTMTATLSGLLFGYNLGIINGANLVIKKDFKLDDSKIEHIVASAVAAAAIFALMSGAIADAVGRKISIQGAAVVFTAGGIVMAAANGYEMLLLGRVIVGAAIGVVSNVVPVYVSECAPANIRGRLLTFNQLFITIGIWLSSIFAGAFQSVTEGWRFMLGLSAIPGIIQILGFLTLPESPRFQVMRGQTEKAEATLKKIRRKSDVSEELNEIVKTWEEDKVSRGWDVFKGIFQTPHVRYALFIGCMLQLFQQFCGINSVIYYSSNILKSAGFDVKLAIWLSVIPFTVNFLATFLGIWAVEVLGRTKVLAASYIAIAISLWILVFAFIPAFLHPTRTNKIFEPNITGECLDYGDCWACIRDDNCAFCGLKGEDLSTMDSTCVNKGEGDDAELYSSHGRCSKKPGGGYSGGDDLIYSYGYCPSNYALLAVVGLILYVLGFAPGAGPMPWTINAEIYPMWCRSVANSLATVTNWSCNFLVGYFFLTVTKLITSWGTFLVFSVICILGALFSLLFVPETKDLTLEEIELLFMTPEAQEEFLARKNKPKEEEVAPVVEADAEVLDETLGAGDAPAEAEGKDDAEKENEAEPEEKADEAAEGEPNEAAKEGEEAGAAGDEPAA